jgi:hypothetical protein
MAMVTVSIKAKITLFFSIYVLLEWGGRSGFHKRKPHASNSYLEPENDEMG